MIRTKNETTGKYDKKNLIIVHQLTKIFTGDNYIYISYAVVKIVQAVSALAALVLTIIIYLYSFNHSALLSIFSNSYDLPTFYCQIDQFELLISPFSPSTIEVPCIEIASRSTVFILLLDFVLLFIVLIFSIFSIFQWHPKELEFCEAAKFSFHTGLSPRHYKSCSKWFDPRRLKCIGCDLDFLVVLLRRTDAGLADILWEVQAINEILLLNNDDFMRSSELLQNGGLYYSISFIH